MYVNSVKSNNVYSFRANENSEIKDVKPEQPAAAAQEISATNTNEDKFEKKETAQSDTTSQPAPEAKPQNAAEVFMSQLNKMQKVQKILGGTLLGIGVLGALSFLSSKKWVRGLFAIPAGGALAFFGANMLNNAKALDKLKQVAQTDK